MADAAEIQRTYDWMDDLFRRAIGPQADITCAFYNGDYSLSLEQAQASKHAYMLDAIGFRAGMRVLDIGSGWGPFLKVIHDRGGEAVGLTLSRAQAAACRRNGLTVYLQDWKEIDRNELGSFDAIVSVGAFEHFCSVDEFRAGKQDDIYRSFFRLCSDLLPDSGRLFLQTMVWGQVPDVARVSLRAPKDSNEYLLALLEKFYPGSWLPDGKEQVIRDAEGFKLIEANSGRLDYIQTMKVWGAKSRRLTPALLWGCARLLPRYLRDSDFRWQVRSLNNAANRKMFERGVMDHFRMTFEKV